MRKSQGIPVSERPEKSVEPQGKNDEHQKKDDVPEKIFVPQERNVTNKHEEEKEREEIMRKSQGIPVSDDLQGKNAKSEQNNDDPQKNSVSISDNLFVSTACIKHSGFWFFRHPLSSYLYAIFWLTCHLHVFPLLPQGFCLWTSPILSSLRFFYPRPDSFSVLHTSFHRALPVNMVLLWHPESWQVRFDFVRRRGETDGHVASVPRLASGTLPLT
ncbi:uncharacterized protein LOC106504370 isoform X3 [Sus scrofa]|uniref:uncharacterized protein LOC106504370 isoform X3 n=1 Tax=Sus scrofa TaxID=9823 RepID=UPI000A2B865E|nr:uncharacterized protein LOC106504370 isoform X3 [Sus scrofa]